jgi:hypothetical protein
MGTTLTEDQILELGFVKDSFLSTDEMLKYDFSLERKDLNPLYTFTVYTLYWDLIDEIFDLIGRVSQNNQRVYFSNQYHGNFPDQEALRSQMRQFLRKDLRGSPLLKELLKQA